MSKLLIAMGGFVILYYVFILALIGFAIWVIFKLLAFWGVI